MKLSGSVTITGPRQKVWDALNDPAVLAQCIPGCEKLEATGPDEYSVTQSLGIAAIKGRYTGKMALQDKQPPAQCTLQMDGKGPGGFMRGSAKVTLTDREGRTELAYDSDLQVGGLLASLGSRLLEPVAKQLTAQFFKALEKRI
jgi:hypothetical protein